MRVMPPKAWCSAPHFGQRSSAGTPQLLTAPPRLLLRRSYDGTVKTPRCRHIWLPLELSSQRNHVRTGLLLINRYYTHNGILSNSFLCCRQTGTNSCNFRLACDPPEVETAVPLLRNASIWALIRERAVSGVARCGDS